MGLGAGVELEEPQHMLGWIYSHPLPSPAWLHGLPLAGFTHRAGRAGVGQDGVGQDDVEMMWMGVVWG